MLLNYYKNWKIGTLPLENFYFMKIIDYNAYKLISY